MKHDVITPHFATLLRVIHIPGGCRSDFLHSATSTDFVLFIIKINPCLLQSDPSHQDSGINKHTKYSDQQIFFYLLPCQSLFNVTHEKTRIPQMRDAGRKTTVAKYCCEKMC